MVLTDANAQIVARYPSDAYGNLLIPAGSNAPFYGFQSKEYDPLTGLSFFGGRYYSPFFGRFISQDPSGMIDGPNVYTYVNNNPINSFDPFGLDTYYVNYELFTTKPEPTNRSISHSYVVTTDNGKVTDTYSWGNNMEGRWFHNDSLDMAVAQKAIDSGIGIDRYGGEDLDYFVVTEFNKIKNQTGIYDPVFNNCKEKATELLKGAKKQRKEKGKK